MGHFVSTQKRGSCTQAFLSGRGRGSKFFDQESLGQHALICYRNGIHCSWWKEAEDPSDFIFPNLMDICFVDFLKTLIMNSGNQNLTVVFSKTLLHGELEFK